jgi:hypothetical protein
MTRYSIALRFADNFAPECGTIAAHEAVIEERGSVWYGKLGSHVAASNARAVLSQDDPAILLIHSGRSDRWWAHIDAISNVALDDGYPAYYGKDTSKFGCWFHVTRLERVKDDVMSRWTVVSAKRPLSSASRHSMSPYFFISCDDEAYY